MALPEWPDVNYRPERTSFQPIKPTIDPITTDFEQGNQRSRSRPGDNVGTVTQTIRLTPDEHDTFMTWGKTTIGNWTGRFTAQIWTGTAYATKVCQFNKGIAPTIAPISRSRLAATMTLRVYDF